MTMQNYAFPRAALVRLYAALGLTPVPLSGCRLSSESPPKVGLSVAELEAAERHLLHAYGVGVVLSEGWIAVEIFDLGAFLRWLEERRLRLPRTWTIEHQRGWVLLYRCPSLSWVEGFQPDGAAVWGAGAVIVMPDTPNVRSLSEPSSVSNITEGVDDVAQGVVCAA